jgi:hypothetical protein
MLHCGDRLASWRIRADGTSGNWSSWLNINVAQANRLGNFAGDVRGCDEAGG